MNFIEGFWNEDILFRTFVAWGFIHVCRTVKFVAHNIVGWAFSCCTFGSIIICVKMDPSVLNGLFLRELKLPFILGF